MSTKPTAKPLDIDGVEALGFHQLARWLRGDGAGIHFMQPLKLREQADALRDLGCRFFEVRETSRDDYPVVLLVERDNP